MEKALENRSKDDISVAVFVLHPHIATTKDTSTNGRVRSVPRRVSLALTVTSPSAPILAPNMG